MTLTINNLTAGTLTYLSGSVSISASSSYTSTDAQLIPFTLDNNLYNDITASNVSLSDGVNTFTLSDALDYLKRIAADYYYRVNLNQNITALNQTVELAVVNMGTIIVQVEGTFVATLNFEATVDGTNWFDWYGMDNNSLLMAHTANSVTQVLFNTGAIQNFRVKCTSYTSGTAVVSISANQGFSGQVSPFTSTDSAPGTFPVALTGDQATVHVNIDADSSGLAKDSSLTTANTRLTNIDTNLALVYGRLDPVSATVGQATTTSLQTGVLVQSATTTSAPTYTTAKTNPLSSDTSGNLRVSLKDSPANTNKFLVTADAITFASPQHIIADASSAVIGHVIVDTAPVTHVIVDSGALNSNQSSNVAQINGVTPLMGAGNGGTGSLRVNIASDQVSIPVAATLSAETTKVIGTVNIAASQTVGIASGSAQIGHLEANQSVNNAQIAGATTAVNNGTASTGCQRVTIASDNTAFSVNATLQTGSNQIGHLEANQSINNAQVNGSTVVTSVTGVQDVMPRKRSGSTGLSPNYSNSHITSKTTTTPTSSTAYVSTIVIACSGAGTSWTMTIKDKAATPITVVPSFTLTVPTTGLPVILQFAEPILMTSGIDIVTAGTTAGTVDVLITYWQ